jgi:tetratricopeptide (TPR) repeat protein
MIIEQHYDEEVLIDLLEETEQDAHVPACETCSGAIESYRDLAAALQDDSVWDDRELSEDPAPETAAMLRDFAATTAAEDAAAGPIVAKLLAASDRLALLEQNSQWRTAGVVRRVLARVDATNFTDPKFAAELAALAAEIAESLDPRQYPLDTVMKLRATAWRERAYALCYIGSFLESLAAVERTDKLLRECTVSEYDSARAQLVRALVYGETERLEEAIALAESARDVFCRFGDIRRESAADTMRANMLMYARRFAEALAIHRKIASDARIDQASRAFALHNMAICHRELSQFRQAKSLFAQTVVEFERLGFVSERAKARWSLAKVLMAEQQYDQAWPFILEVRQEFEELGMSQDVALVSLDMAEALLMLSRPAEVVDLCQAAMDYFRKAGLAYTQGALTALAYLKEAAEARVLTRAALQDIRTFFELLPKQPHLLFAYPT